MPFAPSTKPTPARSKLSRSGLFVSAGLVAALAIGVPVAANAAPAPATVVLSSTTATATAYVGITADGFQPNEALTFTLDAATLPTYPGSTNTAGTSDAAGKFEGSAYIPAATTVGTHTITVTGTTTAAASTTITIVAQPTSSVNTPSVSLSTYSSKGVTATFAGFAPGATVSFGIGGGQTGDQAGADAVANASGVVTLTYVPKAGSSFSTVGSYTLSAFAASGSIAATPAAFTVVADSAVTPADPATPVKKPASFTG
ncbi:hypothetical protein [Lacisediminihabitans sp.]|uniref:hypothetical protein n=1 Tax=Lacisediminihabitans sp. TaxID=2787631 RepID=UPI00374DCE44